MMKKDYYKELDEELQGYENHRPYHKMTMDQIADKINWCWKWRKISFEEMEDLANRATIIFEGGV